jgi:trigger factor
LKVSATELPSRQVSLAIEVEQDRLDRALDQAYRRIASRVDVPGFRRGKAPRSMVERMVGRGRITDDALDQLLPEVVNEAIEGQGLSPYTRPRVESVEFDPLRVKATVPLAPKVELGNYARALRVEVEQPEVTQDQIDAVVERLRESYAQWVPVDRPVQLGDRVALDLRAVVDGRDKPLLDSTDAEFVVDPEGAQPAPGFAEQLVGLEAGADKTFRLQMAEDYRDAELQGKPVEFTIHLRWVKERELPEVDETFAGQVGDYSDVAALRQAIEGQLRQRAEERAREQLEHSALDKLVELSAIEFPPQLADHQAQRMLEELSRRVEQQGLQFAQYLRLIGKDEDALRQEMRTEAEQRVRRSLALEAFADAEKVEVDESEVQEEVRRAAAGTNDAEAVERLALANPTTLARVRAMSRERKALARLVEVASGSYKKATAELATSDTEQDRGTA